MNENRTMANKEGSSAELLRKIRIKLEPVEKSNHETSLVPDSSVYLNTYLPSDNPSRPFQCETCDKDFRLMADLICHKLMHLREEESQQRYKEAMSALNRKTTYESGIENWPRNAEPTFPRFRQKRSRIYGKGTKTGVSKAEMAELAYNSSVNPHKCDECGKEFGLRSGLMLHGMIHSAERKFECPLCNKRFYLDSELHEHWATHSSDKPFKCEFCERDFVSFKALRKHQEINCDPFPVLCEICGKMFTRKYYPLHRASVHEGEKLIVCERCGKQFSQVYNLNMHILFKHNGDRPFSCASCNRSFKRLNELSNHLKRKRGCGGDKEKRHKL